MVLENMENGRGVHGRLVVYDQQDRERVGVVQWQNRSVPSFL
jgi:hypothetical protein